MAIPGENLLIKMWESLAVGGVGSLLKPWQMRREAYAKLEIKRREMLLLAQAEREVEEIRAGRKKAEANGNSLMLLTSNAQVIDGRAEPQLDLDSLLDVADRTKRADTLREQINVTKTILHAEDILSGDNAPAPTESIEQDWLYRWRDCASQVSSDELQSLWAKVLAGEVKTPGAYSLRTLEFLRNLSKSEAEEIQGICPYVVDGQYIMRYGEMAPKPNEGIDYFLRLQELGIISGVGGLGLSSTWKFNPQMPVVSPVLFKILNLHGKAVICRVQGEAKNLVLDIYRVTPLGIQVLALNPVVPSDEYVRAVAEACKAQGFDASFVTVVPVEGVPGATVFQNEVKV
ncbi:DUF2806 domain-containing protein [Burkholderia territorii]|uniref:DUF2806 domain-containing protein n=1 Tax=Burkholderia territorii TaxID=1503055 RepID=UPI0007BA81F2|nr:DUF2806 domain-containing protein [Burkholderia territorii]